MKKKHLTCFILISWIILIGTVQATEIIDVSWDSDMSVIHIGLDSFPTWNGWRMYVDGEEIPLEGGEGNPVIRPNAPLEGSPTGLIIGTEPWVTGLATVNFPCCGTIQLDIPNEGLTKKYDYNLFDLGCETASSQECPSEWIRHYGDLIIEGTKTKIIKNIKYFQEGNIYVKDQAKLIIQNSELMVGRGDVPTVHVYIFVAPSAELEIIKSRLYPQTGICLLCVMNQGTTKMKNSPTSIHYFDMSEGASLTMIKSEMVFKIGGLLQITGGNTKIVNSTIGALGLRVPAGAHMEVTGLKSGVYFKNWSVQEMIPEADYELTLINTHVLKDDFTGDLKHGPFERGWLFFLDPDAHVKISDSELRKVFLELRNEDVEFENLKVGIPSSLSYRDIELSNITVMGQWPFMFYDSNITIRNSDYLFLQPSGESIVTLVNSHIVEFIPREFFGTIIFENGLWTVAGEIIGGEPHHSMSNDFTIKGSLKIEGLRETLQWKDATVKREYEVIVQDSNSNPLEGMSIKIDGSTFVTNLEGKVLFNLLFDENNYDQLRNLELFNNASVISQTEIDFFTETPIVFTVNPAGS